MQLMHMLNCLYSSSSSGVCRYSPSDSGFSVSSHDPRLHAHELPHEVADVDDEIADDGEIRERLHPDRTGCVVREEGGARQLRARR